MPPRQKTAAKWNIYAHFCDLLVAKYKDLFEDVISPQDLPVLQDLFVAFKTFTVSNKNFKGFPTNSGHRKQDKGFPLATSISKEHPEILRMFELYFNKNEQDIKKAITEVIEKFPNLNDSIDVQIKKEVIEESFEQEEQDDDEEFEFEPVLAPKQKEEPISTKQREEPVSSTEVLIPSVSKRKIANEDQQRKQRKISEEELTKEFIITLKKNVKNAVTVDSDLQNPEMANCRKVADFLKEKIQYFTPLVEQEIKNLEKEKEEYLQLFNSRMEGLTKGSAAHLDSMNKLMTFVDDIILKKEEEFRNLKEKEEEDLDKFFADYK